MIGLHEYFVWYRHLLDALKKLNAFENIYIFLISHIFTHWATKNFDFQPLPPQEMSLSNNK